MRLFNLGPILTYIVVASQAAASRASPLSSSTEPETRDADDHHLQLRAPTAPVSITVLMERVGAHNTWVGYRFWPGLGGASVSDRAVQDTAYLTYEAIKNKLDLPGLVSVIYVPGGGWAAGSVWQGSDESFQQFARKAEVFWHSVPVGEQELNPDMNGVHQWHAKAVAAAKAEMEFEDAMVDGLWPEGTVTNLRNRTQQKIRKEGKLLTP